VPHHADDYVHRIGRTGRAGRLGDTFMIVTPADGRSLDKVLKLTGKAPDEVTLDIDWSQIKPSEARAGRGERSSRERGGARGRDRAPRPDHSATGASMEPLVAPTASENEPAEAPPPRAPREARRPREDRSERAPRRARGGAPKPAAEAVQTESAPAERAPVESARPAHREARPAHRDARPAGRPQRDERPRRDDNDDRAVKGFGADTPAFLLRAPTPRPASSEE
jgi:superfamily II DNA/RNA helicase